MISNKRMYRHLLMRWSREDEMTEERLDDCLMRMRTEGDRAKYTGPEKFRPLAFLKVPKYWILNDATEDYDEETGELIARMGRLVRVRKPEKN